jgi:hypothetical protein
MEYVLICLAGVAVLVGIGGFAGAIALLGRHGEGKVKWSRKRNRRH